MTKQGLILRDANASFGLVAVDGRQYLFLLKSTWQSGVAPKAGMLVDVTFNADGAPERIEPS